MYKEIGVLIQARLSSKRLPGKILFRLGKSNYNSISLISERLKDISKNFNLLILTTFDKCDDAIVYECQKLNLDFFRGDKEDVLKRYYKAALNKNLKTIIRITSDCPFIDSSEIKRVLKLHLINENDYTTNSFENSTIIDGMDVEVFSMKALKIAFEEAKLPSEREHVTFYFQKNNKFKIMKTDPLLNYPYIRLTLDTPSDYKCISNLIDKLNDPINIGMREIAEIYQKEKLFEHNKMIPKNAGWLSSFDDDKKFLEKN